MFNATLAGHQPHHLRADYSGSRGGSRASSRYDINEVGRLQVSSGSSIIINATVCPSVSPSRDNNKKTTFPIDVTVTHTLKMY